MEVGESSRKEVPRPGEGNQLNQTDLLQTRLCLCFPPHEYCHVACGQSSHGEGVNMKIPDRLESAGSVTSIGSESGGTCVQANCESLKNMSFADLLSLADAAPRYFTATHLGTNYGVNNPFIPISQSHTIDCSPQQAQGTYAGCYRKTISQFAPPKPDKSIRGESRRVAEMQINVEEEKNVPNTKLDNGELSEPVIGSSLAAVYTPLNKNHNLNKGGNHCFDLNQPPPKESPTCKSAYLKRKGLDKASTTSRKEVTGESTESVMPESIKKSCSGFLNFETGEQPQDQNSAPKENVTMQLAPSTSISNINSVGAKPNANFIKNSKRKDLVTTQDGREKRVTQSSQNDSNSSKLANLMAGLHVGVTKRKHSAATELAHTSCKNLIGAHYNGLHAYQTMLWDQFPNVRKKRKGSLSNNSSGARPNANFIKNSKGKNLMTTQDGHEKTVTLPSKNDSKSSKSGKLMAGLCKGVTKRRHSATTELAPTSCKNLIGALYNGLHAYQTVFWDQLPNVQNKRKGSLSSINSPGAKPNANFIKNSKGKDLVTTQDGYEKMITQSRPTIRRSRAPTRFCDSAPLTTSRNCNILPNHFTKQPSNFQRKTFKDAKRPSIAIDALVAEMSALLTKKKRPTRRNTNTLVSSAHSSRSQMQLHQKFLLDSNHRSLAKSLGAAQKVTSKNMPMMDALT